MTDIHETLQERGGRYGSFEAHAKLTQDLKNVMRYAPSYSKLTPAMIEALEMIQHKVGRILNGDPSYKDSWVDIAGYATLVADTLHD